MLSVYFSFHLVSSCVYFGIDAHLHLPWQQQIKSFLTQRLTSVKGWNKLPVIKMMMIIISLNLFRFLVSVDCMHDCQNACGLVSKGLLKFMNRCLRVYRWNQCVQRSPKARLCILSHTFSARLSACKNVFLRD